LLIGYLFVKIKLNELCSKNGAVQRYFQNNSRLPQIMTMLSMHLFVLYNTLYFKCLLRVFF